MASQSIETLVVSAQAGQRQAYAQLMERTYKSIYLLCLSQVGDAHDAEDCTQEAFLKGFEKLRQLKEPGRFSPWLGRIARNLCREHLRRRRPVALEQEPPAPASGDSGYRELRELVNRMPKELRLPLVMYYLDGRNVKTVAQMMRISVSNAYGRIRKATQALQELFVESSTDG